MRKIDLGNLNLDELKTLKTQVQRAIDSYEERKKKEALTAIHAAAQDHGFKLDELTGQKIKKPVKAKYVNPDDPSQVWTGRGRKPFWVTAALKAGKTLEDLAI